MLLCKSIMRFETKINQFLILFSLFIFHGPLSAHADPHLLYESLLKNAPYNCTILEAKNKAGERIDLEFIGSQHSQFNFYELNPSTEYFDISFILYYRARSRHLSCHPFETTSIDVELPLNIEKSSEGSLVFAQKIETEESTKTYRISLTQKEDHKVSLKYSANEMRPEESVHTFKLECASIFTETQP